MRRGDGDGRIWIGRRLRCERLCECRTGRAGSGLRSRCGLRRLLDVHRRYSRALYFALDHFPYILFVSLHAAERRGSSAHESLLFAPAAVRPPLHCRIFRLSVAWAARPARRDGVPNPLIQRRACVAIRDESKRHAAYAGPRLLSYSRTSDMVLTGRFVKADRLSRASVYGHP